MSETKNLINEPNYYCSLFIDSDVSREDLTLNLAKFFGVSPDRHYLSNEKGEVGVMKNKDYDSVLRKDGEDGFLYYRYLIEVEPNEELGEENAVAFVSKILEYLWSQGYPATAACDYEDSLPNKGKLIPENHSWNEYYIWK
jgi:hypothetical protein